MNGTYNQRIYRKSGLRVPARSALVSLSLFLFFLFFFVTVRQRMPLFVNRKESERQRKRRAKSSHYEQPIIKKSEMEIICLIVL